MLSQIRRHAKADVCKSNIKRDIVVKKIKVKYHFKIRHFCNNNYFAKCNKSLDREEIRLLSDASFDSILYIVMEIIAYF